MTLAALALVLIALAARYQDPALRRAIGFAGLGLCQGPGVQPATQARMRMSRSRSCRNWHWMSDCT